MLALVRRWWFSSRKIRLGIPPGALVLEVGSGDSPCPRSDVLFDMTLESFERVGGATVRDRPLILGNAEHLPFADKAFDYVLAFHVLEHVQNPEAFLGELQRVARAGYLETPSLWAERLFPLSMHRLEVGLERDGEGPRLIIHKKGMPNTDGLLSRQFQSSVGDQPTLFDPESLVTRYWWKDRIRFRVANPEVSSAWNTPEEDLHPQATNPRSAPRRWITRVLQGLGRRRTVDVLPLLRCPDCGGGKLNSKGDGLVCTRCSRTFPVKEGIPQLFPGSPTPSLAVGK